MEQPAHSPENYELYIHKYKPMRKGDYFFHTNILDKLINFANNQNLTNIIFYGCDGSGKYTLVQSFLYYFYRQFLIKNRPIRDNKEMSDEQIDNELSGICKTKEMMRNINKNDAIKYYKNKYYFEIDASDYGYNDKKIFNNFIEEISKTINIINNLYNVIVIRNAEFLSLEAQYTLRKTMEFHFKTCKLLFITNNLSRIDDAIRSRCIAVRIDMPSYNEISSLVKHIYKIENRDISTPELSDTNLKNFIENNNRNLNQILIRLQFICMDKMIPYDEMLII